MCEKYKRKEGPRTLIMQIVWGSNKHLHPVQIETSFAEEEEEKIEK